jgi:hypothetical protein
MFLRRTFLALAVLLVGTRAEAVHDAAFWTHLAAHDTTTAADAPALARELVGLLGSPDPAVRDEAAYTLLVSWIYQRKIIAPAEIVSLTDVLLANLKDGVGEVGDLRVLRRSFSALVLSIIVARDNDAPFFTKAQLRRIWDAALAYLLAEKDLRGHDEKLGWIHATAHTADLLKFLIRSKALDAKDSIDLLRAIKSKLSQAPLVFIYGEDERLARTALAVVKREDFAPQDFDAWLKDFGNQGSEPTSELALHQQQNYKNFLSKLSVLLDNIDAPTPSQKAAQTSLRRVLKNLY